MLFEQPVLERQFHLTETGLAALDNLTKAEKAQAETMQAELRDRPFNTGRSTRLSMPNMAAGLSISNSAPEPLDAYLACLRKSGKLLCDDGKTIEFP